jgi:uncharacterized OB-fold protein
MRVEAVFKPKEERRGEITDIKYFRPIGGVATPFGVDE